MQEERERFWQSHPRLKSFLKWFIRGSVAFLMLFTIDVLVQLGFGGKPLTGFNRVFLLILVGGLCLLIAAWEIVGFLMVVVEFRWNRRQRYPRRPEE